MHCPKTGQRSQVRVQKNTTDPAMGLFFYWKEKAMDWLKDYTGDIWYTDVIAAYEESKESEE